METRRFEEIEERLARLEEEKEELVENSKLTIFKHTCFEASLTFLFSSILNSLFRNGKEEDKMVFKMRMANELNTFSANLFELLQIRNERGEVIPMDKEEKEIIVEGIVRIVQIVMDNL